MEDASAIPSLPNDPQVLKSMIAVITRERDTATRQRDEVERRARQLESEKHRIELEKQKIELQKQKIESEKQRLELEKLRLEVELLRYKKWYYGPKADRLQQPADVAQMLLQFACDLESRPVNPNDLQPETSAADAMKAAAEVDATNIRRVRKGRRNLAAFEHLPVTRKVYDLTEAEKPCPGCGEERQKIGEESTWQIEYIPGRFERLEHVQIKYACKACERNAENPRITLADKPIQPIDKGMAGPGLLAYVIASKYSDYRVQGEAVFQMRGGLSWPGDRVRPQTSPNCGGQGPSWETSGAIGATRLCQVRSAKSNASEPPMKCRNGIPSTSKPGSGSCSGISMGGACTLAHVASGTKAARSRNRLGHGTLEPVASMPREKPKRTTRQGESTDARHRDGTIRSSEEGRVMRLERRGRVIQSLDNRSTAQAGGTHD